MSEAGYALRELDGIAFGAGPGSFTGIRIACGLAQGLALANDLPVVPIATLEALAEAAWTGGGHSRIVTCLDARMREVYVAAYARIDGLWETEADPAVMSPTAVAGLGGPGWFGAGNGFAAYPALAAQLELATTDGTMRPSARAVAELGLKRLARGEAVAAEDAMPLYVRHRVALTTAERDAGERL